MGTSTLRRWYAKRPVVFTAALVGALAISGTALAYWTSTGTGTATGTSSTGTASVTLTGTVAAGLAPGLSRTVTFTAANPGTAGTKIGTVHLESITSSDGAGVGCNAPGLIDDFTMADFAANQVITAGATAEAVTATGTLVYAYDAAVNQDACKGDTMTLTVSVSAAA